LSANESDPDDDRRAFVVSIKLLANEAQIKLLMDVLELTLCDGPEMHSPPCRFAWAIDYSDVGDADPSRAASIAEELAPVEVLNSEAVVSSLASQIARLGRPGD
jgi:hypothetical protein